MQTSLLLLTRKSWVQRFVKISGVVYGNCNHPTPRPPTYASEFYVGSSTWVIQLNIIHVGCPTKQRWWNNVTFPKQLMVAAGIWRVFTFLHHLVINPREIPALKLSNSCKKSYIQIKKTQIWAWIGPCSSNFQQTKPEEPCFRRPGFCIRILKHQVLHSLKK